MNIQKYIINKDDLPMDSLIIYNKDKGLEVDISNPLKINIRSIAKTVMAMACGILIEKSFHEFNEDTYVYPIIKNKINLVNKDNLKYLEKLQVKDLLTHTIGFRDMILMSKDIDENSKDDLLNFAINYPIYYNPGEYFLYSNAGMYILAATMEEYLGYPLYDFINDELFKPLDISNARWDRYGDYIIGSTKLYLNADDMLKIGELLLFYGKYKDKEIISSYWIKNMMTSHFDSNKELKKHKYISDDHYGYGLWISDEGIIFASGTGGQFIIIIKEIDTVIVTTNDGDTNKSYLIRKELDYIIDNLLREYHER